MMTVEQIMNLAAYYAECRVGTHIRPTSEKEYNDLDAAANTLRTAIEELAADAARLEWAMHYIPGAAWRHVGVNYNAGCTREDIDAAIDAAMKEST